MGIVDTTMLGGTRNSGIPEVSAVSGPIHARTTSRKVETWTFFYSDVEACVRMYSEVVVYKYVYTSIESHVGCECVVAVVMLAASMCPQLPSPRYQSTVIFLVVPCRDRFLICWLRCDEPKALRLGECVKYGVCPCVCEVRTVRYSAGSVYVISEY